MEIGELAGMRKADLDKAIYQKRRAELTKETEWLDVKITELEAKLQETELVQDEETRVAVETAERFYGAAELDQKIVDALIEKVMVYDPRHVEIRWKFSDEVWKLLRI